MTTVATRAAQPRDAAFLPPIERSAAQLFSQVPSLAWIATDSVQTEERHLELIKEGTEWVAIDDDDKPIGFLNGDLVAGNLHICEVSVHADHQRKGIGRRLIQAAKDWATAHGCPYITLTTFRAVPWNEVFYHSLGFRTLASSEVSTSLAKIMDGEAEAGLALETRCAMSLSLA